MLAIFQELEFRTAFVPASANRRVVHLAALRQRVLRWGQDQAECLVRRWADSQLPRAARDFQNWDLRLMLASACQTPKAQGKLPVPVVTRQVRLLPPEPLLDLPAPVSSTPDHEE